MAARVRLFLAMCLARMGLTKFTLIDHDEIQEHTLDRLDYATQGDIGLLKVNVAKERALKVSTVNNIEIHSIPYSVAEPQGYQAALDCDVLFSLFVRYI